MSEKLPGINMGNMEIDPEERAKLKGKKLTSQIEREVYEDEAHTKYEEGRTPARAGFSRGPGDHNFQGPTISKIIRDDALDENFRRAKVAFQTENAKKTRDEAAYHVAQKKVNDAYDLKQEGKDKPNKPLEKGLDKAA